MGSTLNLNTRLRVKKLSWVHTVYVLPVFSLTRLPFPLVIWSFRQRRMLGRYVTVWATSWQNQQNDCVPSEDSDQPGHPPSLKSQAFLMWTAKTLIRPGECPGCPGHLIWVFAGHTFPFVGFVMTRLFSLKCCGILHVWYHSIGRYWDMLSQLHNFGSVVMMVKIFLKHKAEFHLFTAKTCKKNLLISFNKFMSVLCKDQKISYVHSFIRYWCAQKEVLILQYLPFSSRFLRFTTTDSSGTNYCPSLRVYEAHVQGGYRVVCLRQRLRLRSLTEAAWTDTTVGLYIAACPFHSRVLT